MRPLEGRRAIVTGGGRGIGAAIVRALCEDGADVAFTVRRDASGVRSRAHELATRFGVRCHAIVADHGAPESATALLREGADGSPPDIVVVNAGVNHWSPVDEPITVEAREELFRVNLLGAVAIIREAASHVTEGGRIVVVGSTAQQRTGTRGLAEYAATKAALGAFVRGAARDLGHRGITVNLVRPGHIETDMNPRTPEALHLVSQETALGRFGRTAEVAAVVAFLVGPSASFVTGATIDVDGGGLA